MATLAQKACGCKRHADFNAKEDEGSVKLIKLSSKKVKTQVISELKKNNDITDRTMYLCTGCINHVQNDSCISSENVENFLHKIRCQYDNKKLVEIASALGQKVREEICSQAKSSSHHYRILESINDFDTTEYVRSRNVVLTAFLFAVAGEQLETCPINILLYVVMAADCVYACAYPKFVTILCFMVNLLSYIICGSKSVCRIISSVMPSGCYNTIINWLKENSSSSLEVPAKEDIVTFFDNSQILSRNWRVRFDSKVLLSAITTSIHILPPVPSFLQSDASLSPSSWLYSNPDPLLLTSKIRDFITHHESKFSVYRTSFLKVLLNSVRNEMDNGIISDINIADACDVHSLHVGSSSVVTGDPIFLNPCSNQAVRDVLGHIRDNNCKDKRSWSIIGCDGLPYILGSRLIDKSSDLQDIYLIPGLGHFEMNMTKSCFKLLWKVLFEDVAKLMGYKSIKALAACQRCSDHHKAWQLLTIAFVAVSKEIAAQFISECKTRNLEPEIDNFFQHLQNSTNPNVTFLYHSFFTYVFGLFLFRAGERMNNSDIILCSRIKFSTLFFGFNQTFYQEIEMRDTKARVLSPTPIHDFMCKNETFTVSGDVSKGEGGDFILESKNRKIKRMMPPGHPSKDTWTRVVRNADNTDQVREKFEEILQLDAKKHGNKPQDLTREIREVRNFIRDQKYIENTREQQRHTSISGVPLDIELKDFASQCKGNREIYLDDLARGLSYGKGEKLVPIFILPEDRDSFYKIENKTKAELQNMIHECINDVHQYDEKDAYYLRTIWDKDVKKGTKLEYINFYAECITSLQQASANIECEENE